MKHYYGIIAATDNGSSKTFSSIKSAHLMEEILKSVNLVLLLDKQCTKQNFINEINKLKKTLEEPNNVGIIYYAGHGNCSGKL